MLQNNLVVPHEFNCRRIEHRSNQRIKESCSSSIDHLLVEHSLPERMVMDHHLIASRACDLCIHIEASAQKVYVIASNFLHMYKSPWIQSDIHFLTGVAASWMSHHMQWFQDEDPNVGCHGYLAFHCVTQYHLQLQR